MSTAALEHAVFSLPVAERITLADRLYASVPEEVQTAADRAWLAEAERRDAEMEADPSIGLDFDEVISSIRQKRTRA